MKCLWMSRNLYCYLPYHDFLTAKDAVDICTVLLGLSEGCLIGDLSNWVIPLITATFMTRGQLLPLTHYAGK